MTTFVEWKHLTDGRWAVVEVATGEPIQYVQSENKGLLQQWEERFAAWKLLAQPAIKSPFHEPLSLDWFTKGFG